MGKEKGNILLIILIVVFLVGLVVAVYLVGQKTNFLPKAYNPTPTNSPTNSDSSYQNPFEQSTNDSGYTNPFDNLK